VETSAQTVYQSHSKNIKARGKRLTKSPGTLKFGDFLVPHHPIGDFRRGNSAATSILCSGSTRPIKTLRDWEQHWSTPDASARALLLAIERDPAFGAIMPRHCRVPTQELPEWRTAAEMLILAARSERPLMFAEIAMRQALHAGKPASTPTPQARRHKIVR